jgi:hypothetical protein
MLHAYSEQSDPSKWNFGKSYFRIRKKRVFFSLWNMSIRGLHYNVSWDNNVALNLSTTNVILFKNKSYFIDFLEDGEYDYQFVHSITL